jgi:branched-chain amino acid transport system permease protein
MYGTPALSRLLPLLALLLLGALLPWFVPQYFLYIGNVLMMYAVLAIGLDLLLGWAGQFAFAHIAFFGLGAYATVLLQTRFGLPFVAAMPLSAIAAGVLGMLIAFPAARLRAVYLALATFAFAETACASRRPSCSATSWAPIRAPFRCWPSCSRS